MEATGVYWKPVWHILAEGEFALILANAAHVKNVPGRKTDVNDATWLAELLAHGLIRASFVPGRRRRRSCATLLRTRKQLVREQAQPRRSGCRRRWRTPTSSSTGSSPTCWARAGGRCSRRSIAGESDPGQAGRARPPAAQGDAGAAAGGAARAGDARTTASCCGCTWTRSTRWTRRSRGSTARSRRSLAPFRAAVRAADLDPRRRRARGPGHRRRDRHSTWAASRPPGTSSPGPGCARGTTRAPASAAPPACARARPGSRPPWSSAPGRRAARRPATCRPSTTACAPAAAPKKAVVRGRGLDPDRRLPHAQGRHRLRGPRPRPLRPPRPQPRSAASHARSPSSASHAPSLQQTCWFLFSFVKGRPHVAACSIKYVHGLLGRADQNVRHPGPQWEARQRDARRPGRAGGSRGAEHPAPKPTGFRISA